MKIVFDQKGTFEAMRAAELWCRDNGVSVGSSQVMAPRGLLRGDFCISKWRNMSKAEIAALDGTMSGDMREGPVTVTMSDLTPNAALERRAAVWRVCLEALVGHECLLFVNRRNNNTETKYNGHHHADA